jgi:AcrR family transcriptional regulator
MPFDSPQPPAPARQRVLDAALALFSERGYFNTAVPDIVKRSGVSTGSIYHHFGDKQGIARALYTHLLEGMDAALAALCRQHGTAHDRARAVVTLLFEQAEREPLATGFMLSTRHREFMPDEPPICSSQPFNRMRDIVSQGMGSGEIRQGDPVVLAAALFGGPLRLIQLRLDRILPQPLPTYLDEAWEAAWRGVSSGRP